ncbi:MAG: glycoside hydrolase family 27 protein, partial [Phycisphaerae bacterium]
ERTNRKMIEAVRRTGRPIVFNVCEWGKNRPWEWGAGIDGQSWRVTYDVLDMWGAPRDHNRGIGFMKAVDQTEVLGGFQRPGRWNDPDMLVVGLGGNGFVKGGGCSHAEYRTHFGLWCLLSAPLLAACDLRNMDAQTKATLTNPEVIALDQDPLGVPAWRAKKLAEVEVWQKPLQGGDIGVGLLNRGDKPARISARWADLHISGTYRVRDLWAKADVGEHDQAIERRVAAHEMALLRLFPAP